MKSQNAKKRIDSIDIAKGFLCIAVMCIHVNPFPDKIKYGIYPISRVAVPVFFLFTGYLFFSRYNRMDRTDVRRKQLFRKQMKRLLVMYFAWLLILLVPTLEVRPWFDNGFVSGIYAMVHSIIFGSSFIASWYLMACIIGIALIVILKRFLPDYVILLIGAFLYLNGCLFGNYYALGNVSSTCRAIIDFWQNVKINPSISFPVGFFWLALADSLTQRLERITGFLKKTNLGPQLLTFGLACLYFEEYCLNRLGYSRANDCYVFLIPVCALIFVSVMMTDITCPYSAYIRNWSSITYVTHATVRSLVINACVAHGLSYTNLSLFAMVFVICILITAVIVFASELKPFKFLKWLY